VVARKREDIPSPAMTERGFHSVGGLEGGFDDRDGFGCRSRGDRGIRLVTAEFSNPWLGSCHSRNGKTV